MDYAQERITTLHDLTDPTPRAPLGESAVVVPIAGERPGEVTPEHVFETLATLSPADVVVPLRAPADTAAAFREWVQSFDLPVTVLWCNADGVAEILGDHGLDGPSGKGQDVWLGLGVAAERAEYVAVHDADATTYSETHVPRLLAPLQAGFSFVKGFYARIEDGKLYGRLTRLFVAPLLSALAEQYDPPLLSYLSAFRYPLSGEFAFTAEAARRVRAQRNWGLEMGLLGEAYTTVGRNHTAQVDLGVHRHDHRPVDGNSGLSAMADHVAEALFCALRDHGIKPEYSSLVESYRTAGKQYVKQYAADASFNGLSYDPDSELRQVRRYATSIEPPGRDRRLPAWDDVDLSPSAVLAASRASTARTGCPRME